ncbi:flagellar hook-associated family protein [Rhizobium sp. ARZ01]|uniref:flagellar hook-associated family protein n=1 Tax=Rhizobium sp. ARZ01 TaxID=2769313 RepID=UPI00177D795C|nr:flagellar hook-associated family protein [Rhizobium sp. ARZ01]MBD9373845.1 flagellar hook-associated family protein [Rhizobium sp. ARZ01]
MKTSFVSNLTMQSTMLRTIAEAQTEIMQKQKETVTGRHADIGAVLGAKTARTLNMHRDMQRLESLLSTNSLTKQRLAASQEALGQISKAADSIQEALITFSGSEAQDHLNRAKTTLGDALSLFTNAANASFAGEYLFAGIDSDVQPVNSYVGSTAQSKFNTAFSRFFGFSQSDPQAKDITPAQMNQFIDELEAYHMTGSGALMGPPLTGVGYDDWSNASSQNMTSRISNSEVIQSSTNANVDGMRNFALGAMIGYEMINLGLSAETRNAVSARSREYTGSAITGINAERTTLGVSEARIKQADISLKAQSSILNASIGSLEKVDTNETSTRVLTLKSQLELAYTLTGQLQKMSLLNYL